MKQLNKINKGELSFKLNLNYNNVYSRLRMLLKEDASLFADISTKTTGITWYSDDEAEYMRFTEAPEAEKSHILSSLEKKLKSVTCELKKSQELAPYVDDIMEIPDTSFIFYRKIGSDYKFILTGWGCRYAHFGPTEPTTGIIREILDKSGKTDSNVSGFAQGDDIKDKIKSTSDLKEKVQDKDVDVVTPPAEEVKRSVEVAKKTIAKEEVVKKEQHVVLKVVDQNSEPVVGEPVNINTEDGNFIRESNESGLIDLGDLPCYSQFTISFPNLKGVSERTYVVEPKVEVYEAYIKKLIKYSPLLFVEDQNGNTVQNHDVKIMIAGQDTIYNTGDEGMIQLPPMLSGQKFIAIDTKNYANTEEFDITPDKAKKPYRFKIKRAEREKVGITVLDGSKKPIPNATIDIELGDIPCQQTTGADGRAEFPIGVFVEGIVPIAVKIKGKSRIKYDLEYNSEITEYAVQLSKERPKINWKWLGLLPLLALLGWGGYELYKHFDTPTVDEMKTGVVLVLERTSYYVDFGLEDVEYGGNPCVVYFTYDSNKGSIENVTFNPYLKQWSGGTGTGFLISSDGLIATNKHVADPEIPQKSAEKKLRSHFQLLKDQNQNRCDEIQDSLSIVGIKRIGKRSLELYKELKGRQEQVRILDRILNTGNFEVKKETELYVAFTGTNVDPKLKTLDGFIGCNHLISGDNGDETTGKDVAIIQIRTKDKEIPKGAYVFNVPKTDIIGTEMPKNNSVRLIGYNAGFSQQELELQDGLQPQLQPGFLNNLARKYSIGYTINIMPGSSGSPVINDDGVLIAINNSAYIGSDYSFGVRTKYLRELLDKILSKEDKK